MDNIPYHMINNLRPNTRNGWRLKVRLTRMWCQITRNAETVAIKLIFVDALGGRIHASIPAQYIHQLEKNIAEGETYDVNKFVVRRYADMQHGRCLKNDIYIQLNHMTEVMVTGGVDYIQQHVFQFTDLDALYDAAHEQKYLIEFTLAVFVGLSQASPGIRSLENRHECDAGPGVAKMLVLYEVVAFACFLLSSLVAKVLKLLFRLDGKQIRLFIRQGFGVKDALLLLTVFSSVTGIILLTLSVVNVVQIRIGLYSSGSAEARMAIWALCTIVAIALVIYVVSISVAIYASIIGDADIDPVLGQHHSSNRGNNNSADTDVAVQVRGLTQKKDDLVSRS
nr:PREDICTED: uncharacterized protein LOC108217036 [Daucus carota subsp. sativus]